MKKQIKNAACCGMLLLSAMGISITSLGQLPTEYLTKVSYVETKEVTFSLPSESDMDCLTLSELSRYHGYIQIYTMDEYIDMEGDLLTDQKFILEQHIRDEWMEAYSRVTVGKNTIDVYGTESGLLHQKIRVVDANDVFLTAQQAEDYGLVELNLAYYQQLIVDLTAMGLVVVENNYLVTASNALITLAYDHNSKIASATEYDESGLKIKESVVEYTFFSVGDNYFPGIETTTEWFTGENGCCIRKQTVITKNQYEREDTQGPDPSERRIEEGDSKLSDSNDDPDFQIQTVLNNNEFRIVSAKYRNEELEIRVFDMAGKKVIETKVQEGESVMLPESSRAGMYLVHIMTNNSHIPFVGKLIKSNSGSQF